MQIRQCYSWSWIFRLSGSFGTRFTDKEMKLPYKYIFTFRLYQVVRMACGCETNELIKDYDRRSGIKALVTSENARHNSRPLNLNINSTSSSVFDPTCPAVRTVSSTPTPNTHMKSLKWRSCCAVLLCLGKSGQFLKFFGSESCDDTLPFYPSLMAFVHYTKLNVRLLALLYTFTLLCVCLSFSHFSGSFEKERRVEWAKP